MKFGAKIHHGTNQSNDDGIHHVTSCFWFNVLENISEIKIKLYGVSIMYLSETSFHDSVSCLCAYVSHHHPGEKGEVYPYIS